MGYLLVDQADLVVQETSKVKICPLCNKQIIQGANYPNKRYHKSCIKNKRAYDAMELNRIRKQLKNTLQAIDNMVK